ncbi:unnamed protein product [Bathycoccus prasinos]
MLASTGINAYSSRSFASRFASSSSSSSPSSSFRKAAAAKASTTTNRFSALFVSFSKDAIDSASITIGSTAFAHFVTAFPAFADEGLEAAPGVLDGQTSKSYYATLFLFVLSAPGLYSLVKRSAKSKISRKTFELPEISMYFKRNNYVVADAGEVITFEGNIAPERGTAAYITFCIAVGLFGKYYLDNAGRKEKVKVKMVDNEVTTDVIVEGDAEEIERFRRDLNLCEKGMVRVKGILEQ